MDIKLIEKRHRSKLRLIFGFEILLLGVGFLTYLHMKDNPNFTFLSIANIKFLVPFVIALCGFGVKFKNYFLVKFPVILIIFMVLFLFSGKFSFLYSKDTIFFIRTILFFGLLIFSLGVLLEWEIHIDIKSSIEYEENKTLLYY